MDKKNILKYLVPIVAVVVVLESVLLLNNLQKKTAVKIDPVVNNNEVVEMAGDDQPVGPTAFDIAIVGESNLKLATASIVEVKATALMDKALDSVNVYLKYDPMAFDLSNLVFDEKLPTPTFNKVSTTKGLVVVNFLISNPSGVMLKSGEMMSLMSFEAKPKKVGNFEFEISTGNDAKESVTMFVENATSEILPFTSNKLTVNVVK